jgi:type I restriction enzyme M protein
VVSNPPYSVSAFKNNARKFYGKDDFELYDKLTDSSSEIERLFVERAKQLLKDGGVAGIILLGTILTNEGIYTKTREIIVRDFEIIAIAEFGSNTFMETGTDTVILFLRRRNNYDSVNVKHWAEKFSDSFQDVTPVSPFNGIENPAAQYVDHVWEGIALDDYVTLLKEEPNEAVKGRALYREYDKSYPKQSAYYNDDTPSALLEKMMNKYEQAVKNYWDVSARLKRKNGITLFLAFHRRSFW